MPIPDPRPDPAGLATYYRGKCYSLIMRARESAGAHGLAPSATTLTPARNRVLNALRDAGGTMTVQQLAREFGFHPTTIRFHLDRLVSDGLATVTREHGGRRGRPALGYQAIADAADPAAIPARVWVPMVEALARALERPDTPARPAAAAAGRAWADRLDADGPDPVITLFARLGFSPTPAPWGIRLGSCPFAASAKQHPETICAVHLGLAQGLANKAGDFRPISLRPFAEPRACHLLFGRPSSAGAIHPR